MKALIHLSIYRFAPTSQLALPIRTGFFLHPKFIFPGRKEWLTSNSPVLIGSFQCKLVFTKLPRISLLAVRTGLQQTNSLDPIGWQFWYTFTVMLNITRTRSGVQVGNVWAVRQAATGLENIVQTLQSHMILSMSHWSSGLTCLLLVTRVTGSNPLGGTCVKPGFSCQRCLVIIYYLQLTSERAL